MQKFITIVAIPTLILAGCQSRSPSAQHRKEAIGTLSEPVYTGYELAHAWINTPKALTIVVTQQTGTVAGHILRRDVNVWAQRDDGTPDPRFIGISFRNSLGYQTLIWPNDWIQAVKDSDKPEAEKQAAIRDIERKHRQSVSGPDPLRFCVHVSSGSDHVANSTKPHHVRVQRLVDGWRFRTGRDGDPQNSDECVIQVTWP